MEEPETADNVSDSNNTGLIEDHLVVLSQEDDSSDDDDIDTDMERVFAMINSPFNEDTNLFDPEAEVEEYYDDCRESLNDNEIVECVTVGPSYDDDDYDWVNFNDSRFDNV